MSDQICKNGHAYDAVKFWLGCPYCEGGAWYVGEYHCTCPWRPSPSRIDIHAHAPGCPSLKLMKLMPDPKPPRPDWDTIWMDFASALSLRSTCKRASVGCVVVSMDNSTVLGLGYNGGPRGGNNACLSDEPGKCGHLHAEINALIKANYRDASTRKAYLTLSPCLNCATALVNFGIEEVIYRDAYRDLTPTQILVSAGVKVRQFDPKRLPERDLYIDKDRKD